MDRDEKDCGNVRSMTGLASVGVEPSVAEGRGVRRADCLCVGCSHWWVVPVAASVLLLVAQIRIQTYVTGQDPMTYIRLARQILRGPSDPVALREALGFVAPGYPLTLAAVMGLFVVWAAYWVNLVFALLFVFVLWKLMVRLLE